MGRSISQGITGGRTNIPQTIRIIDNTIQSVRPNDNIEITPDGAGVFTINGDSNFLGSNNAFIGLSTFNEINEISSNLTGATGTVVHNYSNGGIFVHTTISANFTANFTNVPTTDDRVYAMVLVLIQGATGRIPNGVQIAGTPQTIRWAFNTTPTPSVNAIDLVSFNLIRSSSTWYVLGNLTQYA